MGTVEQLALAAIPAIVTAIGAYLGVKKSADTSLAVYQAETNMRIEQLQEDFKELNEHVKEHNNLSVRTSLLEQREDATEARLKRLEQAS